MKDSSAVLSRIYPLKRPEMPGIHTFFTFPPVGLPFSPRPARISDLDPQARRPAGPIGGGKAAPKKAFPGPPKRGQKNKMAEPQGYLSRK